MLMILAIVGAAVVATTVATVLVGRSREHEQADDRDADSRGFIGAVLSGLFIVALAFYTVIVWEDASSVEDNSTAEAAAVADAYWQAAVLPQPQRDRIRGLLRDYTKSVVDDEWPRLSADGGDDRTDDLLTTLHLEVVNLPATPEQVQSARSQVVERVREVRDLRRERVDAAQGLSATGRIMLVATLVGAVTMILFPLLVGFTARARHVVQMAINAAVLTVLCVLCVGISHPFDGWLRVEPEAFTSVIEEIDRIPPDSSP
jgi:heme/copper-type cytochrome/quinol oxidase subunit 2